MFDKEVVIEAGGYWHKSLGEDMELIIRMRKLMYEKKEKFKIQYIPESLCWTEVPPTYNILMRQRIRWARGLVQTLNLHRSVMFNPKYKGMGLFSMPYFLFFEFLSPVIELIGIFVILLSLIMSYFGMGFINYDFLIWTMLFVYLFYINITIISILLDELLYKSYANVKEVMKLIGMSLIEPLFYHPVVVFAAIKGYYRFS